MLWRNASGKNLHPRAIRFRHPASSVHRSCNPWAKRLLYARGRVITRVYFQFSPPSSLSPFSPRGPRFFSLVRKLFLSLSPVIMKSAKKPFPFDYCRFFFHFSFFFSSPPPSPLLFRRETIRKTKRFESTDLNAVIVDNISEVALYPSSNYIGVAAPAELGK